MVNGYCRLPLGVLLGSIPETALLAQWGRVIWKGLIMDEIVNGWVDVNRAGRVSVPCPIGDLVGEPHEFAQGSGRLAFLDIMGMAGNVHEVCLACAHPSSEAVVVGGLELTSNGGKA